MLIDIYVRILSSHTHTQTHHIWDIHGLNICLVSKQMNLYCIDWAIFMRKLFALAKRCIHIEHYIGVYKYYYLYVLVWTSAPKLKREKETKRRSVCSTYFFFFFFWARLNRIMIYDYTFHNSSKAKKPEGMGHWCF